KPFSVVVSIVCIFFVGAPNLSAQVEPEIPGHAASLRDSHGEFSPASLAQLQKVASHHGVQNVTVVLDVEWTPEGYLNEEALREQRYRISEAQDRVIDRLPAGLINRVYR